MGVTVPLDSWAFFVRDSGAGFGMRFDLLRRLLLASAHRDELPGTGICLTKLTPGVNLISATEEQDLVQSDSLGANRCPIKYLDFFANQRRDSTTWAVLAVAERSGTTDDVSIKDLIPWHDT